MISVPQSRRQAFFTTAKASGRISSSRRASSSLSWILEISSFQAAVFWRKTSSETFCNSASKALMRATRGRSRLTSRSFLEPMNFFTIYPIMIA